MAIPKKAAKYSSRKYVRRTGEETLKFNIFPTNQERHRSWELRTIEINIELPFGVEKVSCKSIYRLTKKIKYFY